MATPIPITIQVDGAAAAQRAIANVARSVDHLKTAIQPNAGAASSWNPYVAAVQKVQSAQNAAANAARKLAAAQHDAASAGSASRWSPAITAAKRYESALKDVIATEKRLKQDQALGATARFVPVGGRINQLNSRMVNAQSAAQDRYGAVADAARGTGMPMLALGTGGAYGVFRGAMEAGKFQRTKQAIESYEGGDKLFEQLKEFDARSPFNFGEITQGAQAALAQDFKASEILPLFETLGDAVIKAGGGMEQFNSALVQIAQIKTKGVASMQDIRAMAEGAKLPIIPILKEALGDERVAGIMSGDEPIHAEEFFPLVMKGLQDRSKGGMADAMKQLPGQIEELQGAAYMLGVELSVHIVPAVSVVTKTITAATRAFRALPEPVKAIAAYGAVAGSGLMILVGGLLVLAGPLLNVVTLVTTLSGAGGVPALAGALGSVPGAVSTAVTAITGAGGLTAALTVALPLAIATGVGLMVKNAVEATERELENLRKSPEVGDQSKMAPVTTREGSLARAEDSERQASEIEANLAKMRQKLETTDWDWGWIPGTSGDPAIIKKDIEGMEAQLKVLRGDAQKLRARANSLPSASQIAVTSSVQTQVAGIQMATDATSGSTPGAAATSSYQPQIRALEDQLRATKDKKEKAQLKEQLIGLRRAEQDRKVAERDARRAESAAKRQEREQMKFARIGGGVLDFGLESQNRVSAAREEAASKLRAAQSQQATEAEINKIEIMRDSEQISKADAERRISELRAVYERRKASEEAAHRAALANQEAASVLAQAQAEALGRNAEEANAILANAQTKAGEIRQIGAIQAQQVKAEGELAAKRILSESEVSVNRLHREKDEKGKDKDSYRAAVDAIVARLRAGGSLLGQTTVTRSPVTTDAFTRVGNGYNQKREPSFFGFGSGARDNAFDGIRTAFNGPQPASGPRRLTVNMQDRDFLKTRLPNNDVEITFKGTFRSTDSFLTSLEAIG